ncbi:TPA: hypothetical protein R4G84_002891 [Salmonella enterica subsp. enterica serovar Mississippi]|nr:hypothetical protein [Salmonella enterica subsp. enterica]ECW0788946.1 hypothetical protein [Salmonella enterica subsp. enterica]HED0168009.1 hypothetical protein [Salmonella enterica subsp. enterica serovar Mississippi]HED0173873.1 hypothetical protein [Salmonella enterica subsp. enterica serovar Mississippi]HED0195868.1 hypothetical protein [Salmonella enterica subsp. enterica serovar Mississippi]
MKKNNVILGVLLFSANGYAAQCYLSGSSYNVKPINITTVDGYYHGFAEGNIGPVGYISCAAATPTNHGRNIRVESVKSHGNICLRGNTRVMGPGGVEETAYWNSNVSDVHPVFPRRRDAGRFSHNGTAYILTACNPNQTIAPGSYTLDVMLLSWQRIGNRGAIHYKLNVNVNNTESRPTCSISNKGNATIAFGKLTASTGTHQKYYDAQISCTKPTSFSYRLHGATPQINSLPLEVNNDSYLGVGLGVVNGALWVSSVKNNDPLKLSGHLNSADTSFIRINSRVNTELSNISSRGGEMNGSAILEIIPD